jgi:nucleoid DNA-binding protein
MKAATSTTSSARAMTLVVESMTESLAAGEDVRTARRTVRIRGMVSFY